MPGRSSHPLLAAALAVVVLFGASCSEPVSEDVVAGPEVTTVMIDLPDANSDEGNAASDVVRERLLALDLEVAQVGWKDAAIEVVVPVADEELVRSALAPAGELEFRQVLERLDPSTTPTTTPVAGRTAEGEVTASDEEGQAYRLGPVVVGGAGVESARPGGDQTMPTVELTLTAGPSGIESFNRAAAECHSGAPQCPASGGDGLGALAILLDGTVLVAPTINTASFERDQISVSGNFTEAEVRALAAALDGGAANVPWTVRD